MGRGSEMEGRARSEVEQEMETREEQCSGFDIDYDRSTFEDRTETQNPLTEKDFEIAMARDGVVRLVTELL